MWSGLRVIFAFVTLVSLCDIGSCLEPWLMENERSFQAWLNLPDKRSFQKKLLFRFQAIMDTRVNPCKNFYKFACGNYERVSPKNFTTDAMTSMLEGQATFKVRENRYVTTDLEQNSNAGARKMKEFISSCVNGYTNRPSTHDILKKSGPWPAYDRYWRESSFDWMEKVVDAMKLDVGLLFEVIVTSANNEQREAELLTISLNVSSTRLAEAQPLEALSGILEHVLAESPSLPGYGAGMAQRIHALEAILFQIAQSSLRTIELQEVNRPIYELQQRVPSCDLRRLISLIIGREANATTRVVLPSTEYLENVCRLFRETDKRSIADFVFFYMFIAVGTMNENYENVTPDKLRGYCADITPGLFKPLIAEMYSNELFPEDLRHEVINMTRQQQKIGAEVIRAHTQWLDGSLRQRAIKKMEEVEIVVDHPDQRRPEDQQSAAYGNIEIDPRQFIENVIRLKGYLFQQKLGVTGKSRRYYNFEPFKMGPEFVSKGKGLVVNRAAALQPPVYHKWAPSFHKYGGMMSLAGHEFFHNFDPNGIVYDERGQLSNWMPKHLTDLLSARAQCYIRQYNSYTIPGTNVHVNGALTLGENVADEGIKLAYKQFMNWMAENPDEVWQEEFIFAPLQLTHEQAFFLSFAHLWCESRSTEKYVQQVSDDPHAPNPYRVIGTLSNSVEFARAFNCPIGSKMNPTNKCHYVLDNTDVL